MPANRFVSHKQPLALWTAELPAAADLGGWLARLLRLGAQERVYDPTPALVERFGPAGSPLERFLAEPARVRELGRDFWPSHFSHPRKRFGAEAELSWHGPAGLESGVVDNTGELVRRLRPALDPQVDPFSARSRPPLRIDSYPDARTSRFRFELHSDLWFPWLRDLAAEEAPAGVYDNLGLASRHTARLNAFLEATRAATFEAGGEWKLDLDPDWGAFYHYGEVLTPAGVDLDAPPPPGAALLEP